MPEKTVFISADHGLSIVYFLQSELVPTLLASGVRVVLLTDDGLKEQITQRFGQPACLWKACVSSRPASILKTRAIRSNTGCISCAGWAAQNSINTTAMDGHMRQMSVEASRNGKRILPLIKLATAVLRRSRRARRALVDYQTRYSGHIYADLFEKYHPDLVMASTPGWRLDRFLAARGSRARHTYRRGDCRVG